MSDAPLPTVSWADCSLSDGVLEVVLTGTGSGNRLGQAFWDEGPTLFDAIDRHDGVRVVILRGSGRWFSTGIDLMGMAGVMGPTLAGGTSARARTDLRDLILRMQQAVLSLATCRKPVIAAVHGPCIGGGIDVITACDLRVCSADATFSVREARMAIVADMGTLFWLPRLVGSGLARELTYTGEDFDGGRALEIGLVNHCLPDAEATLAKARAIAGRIAANPPIVVQGAKQVMNEGLEADLRAHLRLMSTWNSAFLPSQDIQEAVTAFFEKRAPVFQGD